MMIIRDHLIRHPDRCTQQAICVFQSARPAPGSRLLPTSSILRAVSKVVASVWTPAPRRQSDRGVPRRGRVAGAAKTDGVAW